MDEAVFFSMNAKVVGEHLTKNVTFQNSSEGWLGDIHVVLKRERLKSIFEEEEMAEGNQLTGLQKKQNGHCG